MKGLEQSTLEQLAELGGEVTLVKADRQGLVIATSEGRTSDFPALHTGQPGEQSRLAAVVTCQSFGCADPAVVRNITWLMTVSDSVTVITGRDGRVTAEATYHLPVTA